MAAEVYRLFDQDAPSFTKFDPGTQEDPRNVFAEKAILGSLLRRNKILDDLIDPEIGLEPAHFYDPLHGRIYDEMRNRIVGRMPVQALTLTDWLSADVTFSGDMRKTTRYLQELLSSGISGDIRGHAACVEDCFRRREIIATTGKLLEAARDPRVRLKDRVTALTARLDGAALGPDRQRVSSFDDAMDAAVKGAEASMERGNPGGLPLTGWPRLSRAIVMKPKEMTVLGGVPGAGKSGIGWQIAVGMAREFRDSGLPIRETGGVLGFSLEMSAEALAIRVLSAASGVPAWNIYRGQIGIIELDLVKNAREELRGLPLDIIDANGQTKEDIKAIMYRQMLRWGKIALTVIDHCNLISQGAEGQRHGMAQGTSAVADAILQLGKSCDSHMLALVQLTLKDLKARKDKRPSWGDIRGTSTFEQNANNILFVHREIQWTSTTEPERFENEFEDDYQRRINEWRNKRDDIENAAELIISKNRMGPSGITIPLIFDSRATSFSEDVRVQDDRD